MQVESDFEEERKPAMGMETDRPGFETVFTTGSAVTQTKVLSPSVDVSSKDDGQKKS